MTLKSSAASLDVTAVAANRQAREQDVLHVSYKSGL